MTIEAAPPQSNATALLLNPSRRPDGRYPDERSREIMRKTIEFFERKGKRRLKEDDRERVWYADFLDFVKRERIFATMLTPAGYGAADCRWDTWRICEFAEILGFYGLHYWYTWQVSILGLGPIWMSRNEAGQAARRAQLLEEGAIFALRPLREGARRRPLLDRHGAGAAAPTAATSPAATSTTSATATRRRWSRPSARSPARASTSSSPPTRSTRTTSCVQNVVQQPELRLRVRAARLPDHRGRHPLARRRGLERGAQHGQHRQVQPRLGVDRHLHARALRGDRARRQPQPLRHARDRLPAREAHVHRRLRAPGRDEAGRAARLRLHALRVAPRTGATCSTTRW